MSAEEKRSLPKGWEWSNLGDIAKPERIRVSPQDYVELPFIGMDDVESETMRLLSTKNSQDMKSSSEHFFPGDVLYGSLRPYLNKVYRPEFEGLCSAEFIVFRNNPDLDNKYLQYFLNQWSFVSFINRQNTGDRPRVKFGQMADYPFPIPPLPEQKRIVAEIEKQFTRLDQAVISLKRAQANLQRYKASVLKAACDGRLVPQDPDDEPAELLLQRILAERRRQWQELEWAKLVQKAQKKVAQAHRKAQGRPARLSDLDPAEWQDISEDEYGRYLPKNEKWKEKYKEPVEPDFKDLFGVPDLPESWTWASVEQYTENHDNRRIPVKKADREQMQGKFPYYGAFGVIDHVDDFLYDGKYLLLAEDGKNLESRLRPIALIAEGKFWVNNHAHVMQVYQGCPLEYLENYFNGTDIGGYLTGMDQVKLTRSDMNRIPISIPPLAEQKRIVAEVERRLSVIAANEKAIATDLTRAERLRQSILQRAFSGQLLPQENAV